MCVSVEMSELAPSRAALIGLLHRYLAPGENATPRAVRRLLYFLQEAGEPLKLRFVRRKFGPHADSARQLVQDLEGRSARKERLFTEDHIAVAWERLAGGGWLSNAMALTPA